jgi:hypothetical protein
MWIVREAIRFSGWESYLYLQILFFTNLKKVRVLQYKCPQFLSTLYPTYLTAKLTGGILEDHQGRTTQSFHSNQSTGRVSTKLSTIFILCGGL